MSEFCDVALAVPLEAVFTYRLSAALPVPVVGARVLVPFRAQRMVGVVTALHDNPPPVEAKSIVDVLDSQPVLDSNLLRLGQWIAQYYLAPIGEVFRGMLPLSAELKRARVFSITDAGREALYNSATIGSSLRSRKAPEQQMTELRVLDFLANRDSAPESALRALPGVNQTKLTDLMRKKWIVREDLSSARAAGRFERFIVLG